MKSNMITKMITMCMCMVVVGFASDGKQALTQEQLLNIDVNEQVAKENATALEYNLQAPENTGGVVVNNPTQGDKVIFNLDQAKIDYYNLESHNGSTIADWTDADYTSELSAEKAAAWGTNEYVPAGRDSEHTITVCSDYYSSEGSWALWASTSGQGSPGEYITDDQLFSASYECVALTLTLAPGWYAVDSFDSYGDGGQDIYVDGGYLGSSSGSFSTIWFELADPAGCDGNEISLSVGGGSYCSEVSWDLSDGSSGGCGDFSLCLDDGDYTFNGYDSWGDGWNGNTATFSGADGVIASFAVEGSSGSWTLTIGGAPPVGGCDDESACNYDAAAEVNDGSCEYPATGYNCDGSIADGYHLDCSGQAVSDGYLGWIGDGYCDDGAYGIYYDCCDYNMDNGDCGDAIGCDGVASDCGGASNDDCGVCSGDNSSCADCSGVPNGDAFTDCSGTCVAGWLMGYLGDGWCDGSDAPWGIDLTCYDCDNGDCVDDCGACEGPGSDPGYDCDGNLLDGYFEDCAGNAASDGYLSWQGDGYCDDGTYGLTLTCCDFNMDDGDCGAAIGCDGVASDCGGASNDECGVCGGDNTSCADCAGTPNGDATDEGCGCGEAGPSGCDNACGSTVANDECGVCGGDNSSCADCAGTPNGDATLDGCGTCDSDASNDCPSDCMGEFGGDADYDCSGTCVAGWLFGYLGDGWCDGSDAPWGIDLSCYDCDNGDCSGDCGCEDDTSCLDDCGVPNGDGSSCADCAGTPNGDAEPDYCGVCDGDNVANDCGEPEGCADGEFDCGDGTCIPGSWECDVYWCDCGDCSDEADCGGDDGGDCVNDDSSGDSYGDTCSGWYDANESPGSYGCSGGYDDDDFNAAEQCCACQGAASPGDDDVVDSPHAGDKLAQAKLDYIETSETKMNTPVNNNGSRDDCGGTGPDVGCDGVCYSGLEIDECGDCDGGGLNGDGCCYDLATDCAGTCGGDSVTDCSGTCVAGWLMGYLGDGWCDGSDAPWGIDLTCYDCDNGDCASDCNGDCEGTATSDCNGDCNGTAELDFCGVCAGDNTCDEGGDDGGSACEDGYVADCADDDCCPESWIGDGFADCEDQAFGCDLTCYEGETECEDSGGSEACSDCEYDFTAYGSECCDTAADAFGLSCAALEGDYGWDCSGCNCPLDGDEPEGCADGQFDCNGDGSQCIPGGYVCDGSSEFCNANWGADCSNGADEGLELCGYADECDPGGGCADGQYEDCSGDGDCAPGSWVGDGWCDGTDQPYGYDLTCYDNDGGDCDGRSADSAKSLRLDQYNAKKLAMYNYEQKMAEYDAANASRDSACDGSWAGSDFGCDGVCFSGLADDECGECGGDGIDEGYCDCNNNIDDCADDDCVTEGWIGDGYCDGTDQAYGADLLCYDCDGGDCMGACGCEDDSSCNDCCDVANGDNSSCGSSGDVNGGGVDVTDIIAMVSDILETEALDECAANEADITGDGTVNVLDVIAAVEIILSGYTEGCTDPEAENYDSEADGDDGSCTYPCAEGTSDDCSGDGDCCPDGWIGDGLCDGEDQAWGCDLSCYDDDGGDCADSVCGDGNCSADESYADCPEDCATDADCAASLTVSGSTDLDGDGENDDCYTDGSAYYVFGWDGGCLATTIIYSGGEMDLSAYGFYSGFYFYGFDAGAVEDFVIMFGFDAGSAEGVAADCTAAPSCDELGLWDCGDGQCIPASYVCDGSSEFCNAGWGPDCANGADEGLELCGYADECTGEPPACADTGCGYYLNYGYTCDQLVNNYNFDCSACEAEGACGGDDCVNDDSTSDAYDWTCTMNGSTCYGGYYDDDDFDECSQCCACADDPACASRDDLSHKTLNPQSGPQIEGSILDNHIKKIKNPADVIQSKAPLGRKAAGFESKLQRAESVKLIQTAEGLRHKADGYVGYEITLSHGADFTINVTESAFIADYATTGNTTKVIVVGPETENLFSSTGDYEIVDVIAGTTGGAALNADIVSIPTVFGLNDAYPNPFNPTTSVELAMPQDGFVSVKIYNLMGQVVATLHEGNLTANSYSFTWDAANVASGMYFLKAETAGNMDIQKIMLMK